MQSSKLEPAKWVKNYSDILFAFTLKRIDNNTEQAEDIVQDVFLTAWKSRETYNGTASEKTWLFTICKNKIIDFYRSKEHNTQKTGLVFTNNDDNQFSEDGHFNSEYEPVADWVTSSSGIIQQKEFYTVLEKCKNKLKQIQEQVFTMKYLEDITTDEICEMLNISTQNYWVLIHRAKVQLRTCLEKNWINL